MHINNSTNTSFSYYMIFIYFFFFIHQTDKYWKLCVVYFILFVRMEKKLERVWSYI